MPKSRFNPKNHGGHRNRNNRHDPLSRGGSSRNNNVSLTSTTTNDISQLIPVLSKLPLPDSNKPHSNSNSNSTPLPDLLWALSSVSVLLESRTSTKALLNPQHKLSSRLMAAFKHSLNNGPNGDGDTGRTGPSGAGDRDSELRLQLKREASGALRNLCIEATKNNERLLDRIVVEKGVDMIMDLLIWVSEKLGILENKDNNREIEMEKAKQDLDSLLQASLLDSTKSKQGLNRKEKRQLAKLNKVLEKQKERGSGNGNANANGNPIHSRTETNDTKMETQTENRLQDQDDDKDNPSSNININPNPNSDSNPNSNSTSSSDQDELDEMISLNLIAENCITILWCLIEFTTSNTNGHSNTNSTSQTLEELNQNSTKLSTILSGILSKGLEISICPTGQSGSESSSSTSTTGIGTANRNAQSRRKDTLRSSSLNLTFQSLHTLNSLSENNLIFSIAFLGLGEDLLVQFKRDEEDKDGKKDKEKGKKKKTKQSSKFDFVDPPDAQLGRENLRTLIRAVKTGWEKGSSPDTIGKNGNQNQNQSDENAQQSQGKGNSDAAAQSRYEYQYNSESDHDSQIISIISASILRNLISSLPNKISDETLVPLSESQSPSEFDLESSPSVSSRNHQSHNQSQNQNQNFNQSPNQIKSQGEISILKFERSLVLPFLLDLLERKGEKEGSGNASGDGNASGNASGNGELAFKGGELIEIIRHVELASKNVRDQPSSSPAISSININDPEKIAESLNSARTDQKGSNLNGRDQGQEDQDAQDDDELNNNGLDPDSPLIINLKKLQSVLESRLLAMEILAELVGTIPPASDQEDRETEEEWKEVDNGNQALAQGDDEDAGDGDEEMDHDGEASADENGDEEMQSEMEMEIEIETGASKSNSTTQDQDMTLLTKNVIPTSHQNSLFKSPLISLLTEQNLLVRISDLIQSLSSNLALSFPVYPFTQTIDSSSNSISSSTSNSNPNPNLVLHFQSSQYLRQILFRLSSIQSNYLMNLSNYYSPPPPSTPLEVGSQKSSIVSTFQEWSLGNSELFLRTWTESFGLAAKLAELECLQISEEKKEKVEGYSRNVSKEIINQEKSARLLIENCISNLWSLARLFPGSKNLPSQSGLRLPLSTTSQNAIANARRAETDMNTNMNINTAVDIPSALISAYRTSVQDSMRVKCLSTLGCLARSEHVSVELNKQVGLFFIEILNNLKDSNNNLPSTVNINNAANANGNGNVHAKDFTTAESMVAVLDSLFDIYADENSSYDSEVFRKNDFKGKLRAVWGKVRAEARRIDRRKYPSLREKADEAAQNLMDFIKYRDSLGF